VLLEDLRFGGTLVGRRTIEPRSEVPLQPHRHPERQVSFVLSGTVRVFNGREEVELKEGDWIVIEPDELHAFRTGTKPAELLEVKFLDQPLPPEPAAGEEPSPARAGKGLY